MDSVSYSPHNPIFEINFNHKGVCLLSWFQYSRPEKTSRRWELAKAEMHSLQDAIKPNGFTIFHFQIAYRQTWGVFPSQLSEEERTDNNWLTDRLHTVCRVIWHYNVTNNSVACIGFVPMLSIPSRPQEWRHMQSWRWHSAKSIHSHLRILTWVCLMLAKPSVQLRRGQPCSHQTQKCVIKDAKRHCHALTYLLTP